MLHQGRTIPSHYPKPHLTLPLARTCLASIQAENKDLMYLFPKLTSRPRQLESSLSFSGASGCWLCSRADYISERVSSDSRASVCRAFSNTHPNRTMQSQRLLMRGLARPGQPLGPSLFRPVLQRRLESTAARKTVEIPASGQPPLVGAADNAFNRERAAIKAHAAKSSGMKSQFTSTRACR